MESAGGRQPGVDNAGLIQPQERVPSRLRENKPSVHLGFAKGGSGCVSFPSVSLQLLCWRHIFCAGFSVGAHTCSPFYTSVSPLCVY